MKTLVLSVSDIRNVVASIGLDALMDRTIAGLEDVCGQFARGESEARADFVEQCLLEGDCQQLRVDQIHSSLPELVEVPSRGYAERERLTVFDSTGWSLADHVTAGIVVDEARRIGLGMNIAIEATSIHDPKNPYEFLAEEEDGADSLGDSAAVAEVVE